MLLTLVLLALLSLVLLTLELVLGFALLSLVLLALLSLVLLALLSLVLLTLLSLALLTLELDGKLGQVQEGVGLQDEEKQPPQLLGVVEVIYQPPPACLLE